MSTLEKSSELHDTLPLSSAGEVARQNSTWNETSEVTFYELDFHLLG